MRNMRNVFTTSAIAAILILTILLVAACAPKVAEQPGPGAQPQQPLPAAAEQPLPPAAAEVPEIAQAEQTVQEIGTSDVEEIDKDLDTLVLP
ncbi:hypothetical protein HYV85_01945 [Candidatus Woesearchaeota archaeon]|nr:hypothetical protein [Candidatus Woesearchaeota archaeon]